jgi:CheY-like chemotaxis protein/DNA-binding SARP family transcriptional activator
VNASRRPAERSLFLEFERSEMEKLARILVLEDDDNLRAVLSEVLSDEGFEVTAVNRGEAAVELAGAEAFDLIIADIRMEGMDGLEALERTQQLQPGIGSLIVSGYATEQETARAERLDVGAYINKPFKMQDLLQHVRSELAKRKKQEKEGQSEDFYRRTLDWALNTLAQVIDESGAAEGSLNQAAHTAESMCRILGCETDVCLSARWATILHGSRRLPGVELPNVCRQPNTSLPLLTEILDHLEGHESAGIPAREIQTVRLALLTQFPHESAPALSLEELRTKHSEQYSEEIFQAYDQVENRPADTQPLPLEIRLGLNKADARQRSLVSLAGALERLGDDENAGKAYRTLSHDEVPEKERLEGLLGLARLAVKADDSTTARTAAIAALRLTKSRGPTSLAHLGLEAALVLQQIGAEESVEALNAVGKAAQITGFDVAVALVRCALAHNNNLTLEPNHVNALVSPAAASSLSRYVNWLIQYLFKELELQPESVVDKVLAQVACDFTLRFLYWFDTVRCSPKTRIAVSRALAKAKYLPEQVITRLREDSEQDVRQIGNQLQSRQQGKSIGQLLRVQSFGAASLFSQGEPVPETVWKTRKVKYLFYLLASRWGKSVSEDSIIETFWPKDQTRNKKNLYWATSNLRALIKKLTPETDTPLLREHDALSLHSEIPRWHDLEEFHRSSELGLKLHKNGDFSGALEHLRVAGNVYSGPYLDGCYHEFALELKRTTEETAFEVNFKAGEICLGQGEDHIALEHATAAVELAPFRQDARALRMRSQIRLGQSAQAIDQFHEIEKLLKEDYEIEPSTELLELFHRARLGYTDA